VALTGDAKTVLTQTRCRARRTCDQGKKRSRTRAIHAARQQHGFFNAVEFASLATPILPQRVIKELQNAVANDAMICCDAGENRIFMTHYYQTKGPNTFLQPAGVGGMGYALPAALAAKLIYPQRSSDCSQRRRRLWHRHERTHDRN